MKVDFNYSELTINQKINLKSHLMREFYIFYPDAKNRFIRFKFTIQQKFQ